MAFGPITPFGDVAAAEDDLFQWWSDVVEVPVVAEGGLSPDSVARLAPMTDFFAIGEEIWSADDPVAALGTLTAPLT